MEKKEKKIGEVTNGTPIINKIDMSWMCFSYHYI